MTTQTHDSHTCTLDNGGPCEMCQFSNWVEAENTSFYNHAHDFRQVAGQSSLECICGAVPDYEAANAFPLQHPPLRSLSEVEAARSALEVETCAHGLHRCDTCPPPVLRGYKRGYHEGYAAGWTEAQAVRLRAENEALREDLQEMGRIAGERVG